MGSGRRQVVRDGWRATVNFPRWRPPTTHAVANHNAGELAVSALDAPLSSDLCRFTTNHIDAKWSAPIRRAREKCGGAIPRPGGRNLYIREFQRRRRIRWQYVPHLLDRSQSVSADNRDAARESGAHAARDSLRDNASDLTVDEEF